MENDGEAGHSPESVHFGDFGIEEFEDYEMSQNTIVDEDEEVVEENGRYFALI